MSFKRLANLVPHFAVAAAVFSTAVTAKAYDTDTHFYGTYAMARYAGIKHEVASHIALSAQWMDESFISDPTSMILLPITGIKKRRLFHFPSSRVVGAVAADTQNTILGVNSGSELQKHLATMIIDKFGYKGKFGIINFMTETSEDHPFASQMLMEGLKRGDLMMAAGSLHTLQDSFAHAGTPAEQGHASFWHWPDRPFSSTEKYFRMTDAVFKALVAIRTMLPPAALDCDLRLAPVPSTEPNCQMSAELLTKNYEATNAVQEVVAIDVLKSPEYVSLAIRDLLTRAVQARYLNLNLKQVDDIVKSLPADGQRDAYAIAEILMSKMVQRELDSQVGVVNAKFILADMGRIRANATDQEVKNYVESIGMSELMRSMAQELLKWKVPAPLSDTHRMELEDSKSPLREKEMELRIDNMRALIKELFGTDIKMIENSTKDEAGFAREVLMDRSAQAKIPVDRTTRYVTFNLQDKNRWNRMIFKYLWPSLKEDDLTTIVHNKLEIVRLAAEMRSNKSVKTTADFAKAAWKGVEAIKPLVDKFLSDTVNTRMTPSSDNFYYRHPGLFEQYKKRGVVKQFLGPNDAWSLPLLTELSRMQRGG